MSAHRRHQSGAVRLVPAVKAVLLCSLIGGFCVGYVLQKNQIFKLGQQLGKREQRLNQIIDRNQELLSTLARLQQPQQLRRQAEELGLGLIEPHPSQKIWMTEAPALVRTTNAATPQFAQRARSPRSGVPNP